MRVLEVAAKYRNGVSILRDWLGAGGIAVDNNRAQGRANICLSCPKNTEGWKMPEAMANAIREHVELKNNLQLRVDGEKSLHTCSVCQCALRLKIHVPITVIREHMMKGEMEQFPDFCWQKTEP